MKNLIIAFHRIRASLFYPADRLRIKKMMPLARILFLVLSAFVVSVVASVYVAAYLQIWDEPFVGSVAAATVVFVAYNAAKIRKIKSALIAYLIGSAIAIYLLKDAYYPEGSPRAYEKTLIPLCSTLASGMLALLLLTIVAASRRKR